MSYLRADLKKYRVRVRARVKGEDTVMDLDVRKLIAGKNVMKKGDMFVLKFEGLEIELSEELTKDLIELLLYMIDESEIKKMMEEYCEQRLKWV